ncbi:MAG TPA: ankyrin repeat domain-containing protein [Trebonia sp.]|nr:ankyrin repeat domain-containing protein [Trebonia sp.]
MATARLPDDPSFEQLRRQAKDLRDLSRAGLQGALYLVGAHHPDGPHAVSLTGAQFVVARHYGFSSWAALRRHVTTIERYRRAPDEVAEAAPGQPADEFLLLACLRYGGDDAPDRWQRAARLLAGHPEITRTSVHAAAAAADAGALEALLREDPALASTEGGPYRWEPILYLAYARHDPSVSEDATIRSARLLLGHGADPNAGYLWHGQITPFTALTGALGSGEGGEDGQPQHPHGLALARTLLAAGADPNDGQALYNRQFGSDDSHLALLFSRGLGSGNGGPWRARFGERTDSPAEMVREQLRWAVTHDMRDRVRLLAEHGADLRTPFEADEDWLVRCVNACDGRTPAGVAAICGCWSVLDFLTEHGVPRPAAEGADGLIAAALAGDRRTAERLAGHADAARAQRPGLIVWAASRRAWPAIPLLAELGWDVNARARADFPVEQEWETALHQAARAGEIDAARMLIELGADPGIRDARFDATPLGWAEHFAQQAMADYLRPLTPAK